MVTDRLYPPNIAGTIPSFTQGTSVLEVPFFMNIAVSKSEVKGLKLRLQTTATDIVLGDINSSDWDESSATFQLSSIITNKLILGDYYKVQLAYVATSGVTGYYSTVAIMKYTTQPTVKIDGLSNSTTTVSANAFVGTYQNQDTSEKVYKYKFDLFDDNSAVVLLESSDWQIHNINNDTELGKSNDNWTFRHNLTGEKPFYIKYSIITNNGLTVSTEVYPVQLSVSIATLNLNLTAKLDYENGRIVLSTAPINNTAINLNSNYMFMRASSKDDFSTWEVLRDVIPEVVIQNWAPYTFWDYSVEAGVEYQYSIQSYDANRVFSKRVLSNKIEAWFEDVFLYDGEKQLRIQFNPQVNSFKRTISETKKTTLGRKYPFILRSGIIDYKEFSIGGLISYLMDADELFVNKQEKFINWNSNSATTDLTDENYAWEKTFRFEVLNWLNNGELKLFRSPQEGNYVVRLMNVSLTPDGPTNRLINSFSCSATEMGEADLTSLREFSLINNTEYAPIPEISISKNLFTLLQNIFYSTQSMTQKQAIDILKERDLSDGIPCRKIRIRCSDTSLSAGLMFKWGDYSLTIGNNKITELEVNTFEIHKLQVVNPDFVNTQGVHIELTVPATLFDRG